MRFKNLKINFSGSDLKKGIKLPEKLTLELSEETGWHIGDGSMNFYKNSCSEIGFYDTDGCFYLESKNKKLYPRVEFKTVSLILSKQIENILLSLGLRATRYFLLRKEQNWNTLYTVAVRGSKMLNKIFQIIQPANPKHILKFNFYRDNS